MDLMNKSVRWLDASAMYWPSPNVKSIKSIEKPMLTPPFPGFPTNMPVLRTAPDQGLPGPTPKIDQNRVFRPQIDRFE